MATPSFYLLYLQKTAYGRLENNKSDQKLPRHFFVFMNNTDEQVKSDCSAGLLRERALKHEHQHIFKF